MTSQIDHSKNRNRDDYSFANINLLGKCNVQCFFCLGEDIPELLGCHNQLKTHFNEWNNFERFLDLCKQRGIKKIYITGQNTDSLLYYYLEELIDSLFYRDFQVGIRTNGYMFDVKPDLIRVANACELSVGISIHSLNPMANKMIMGRSDIPDWTEIIPELKNPRVSIVLNRCNEHEFFSILRYLVQFDNLRYVQVRRPSTDTRQKLLEPDIAAYERVYTQVKHIFPLRRRFVTDAEEYEIYGLPVTFWRTVKTSVNSMNFFTDGTISDMYFVVEGYCKQHNVAPQ